MRASGQTLTAVAARSGQRAAAYAAVEGFERTEPDYQSLLDAPDIDAVYIGLTTDAHVPWSIRALGAGKHVLCEKPLAMNAGEVGQLMAVQQRTGLQVMEAFIHPFHPQFDFVREVVASGRLGELRAANAVFLSRFEAADNFRWNREHGGGALFDLGCYCVSALLLLLEQPVVWADAQQEFLGEVDVTTTGLLGLPGGRAATLACSLQAATVQQLSMTGSAAHLVMPHPFSSIDSSATVTVGEHHEHFAPVNPYQRMVVHFAAAARGEVPLKLSLAHSLAQAQVLDALFRAGAGGQRTWLVAGSGTTHEG
ncbi:Oxidoreductase, N-terminal:Oxidoreductase, C-terminal [Deinococcus marmoris]|uniref:Oxidoreductase, N-terminal:Oxidoreductase, C-terminal n=2 Tax=Deinococcus marmoris TaxID=249408 RepID=A0A1U7P3E3_9DEIO|nr:Oxidoreductase, N-terminal:Oxidoreductase, C-terminal [Deinococcus marmoris]